MRAYWWEDEDMGGAGSDRYERSLKWEELRALRTSEDRRTAAALIPKWFNLDHRCTGQELVVVGVGVSELPFIRGRTS